MAHAEIYKPLYVVLLALQALLFALFYDLRFFWVGQRFPLPESVFTKEVLASLQAWQRWCGQ